MYISSIAYLVIWAGLYVNIFSKFERLNQRVTGCFPGFDTTIQNDSTRVAIANQFCRLTGGTRFFRSGTVKDYLLAFIQRRQF
jgi:hypothetical protein